MSLYQGVYNKFHSAERNRMELLSLLFTLFYFFPLFFYEQLSLLWLIKVVLLYVFLICVLLLCVFLDERWKIVSAYSLVALSAAGVSFHMGTNVFFGFALFYLAFHQTLPRAFIALFFTLGCVFVAAYKFNLMVAYFLLPTLIPSAVLFISGVFERKDRLHRKREAMSGQQLERLAAVAERERIARDLHDVLGHTLSSIALKSQLADKLINVGKIELAQKEIKEVSEITRATLVEVRQAISGYKLMTIDERVVQLKDRLREKEVEVEMDCDFTPLKAKAEAAVALLLTEAVTNILRHSQASKVSITTKRENQRFILSVCDNGQVDKIQMGNGLQGIKERVEELGGAFTLDVKDGICLHIYLDGEQLQ